MNIPRKSISRSGVLAIRKKALSAAVAVALLPLASCYTPIAGYGPAYSPEQQAQALRNVNAADDDNFYRRDRERMSRARAQEVATRNNPEVYAPTYAPTYAPRYGY